MNKITISTGHPDAGRVYAEAYEEVLAREAALREELEDAKSKQHKGTWIALCGEAIKQRNDAQQRLTGAEQLLRDAKFLIENSSYRICGASALIFGIDAALKPAAEVEALGARPVGCCCPPKGHNGIWAAAMCPVHFGLKRPGVKP